MLQRSKKHGKNTTKSEQLGHGGVESEVHRKNLSSGARPLGSRLEERLRLPTLNHPITRGSARLPREMHIERTGDMSLRS